MPIQLTNPVLVGSLDPSGQYEHVKITDFRLNTAEEYIAIRCQYGKIVNDKFVPGINAGLVRMKEFIIKDIPESEGVEANPQYTNLTASKSSKSGEFYYDKVAEKLYQWLIDNEHFDGTIV